MMPEKKQLTITFRAAAARDADAIAEMYNSIFTKWVDQTKTKAYIQSILASPRCNALVAETGEEGGIAGFIMFGPDNTFVRGGLNIDTVAVDEKFRGLGLGRAFMKKAEDFALANDFNAVTLQVHEENTGAYRLYEDLGFRTISRTEKYYNDGKAANNMFKILPVAAMQRHGASTFFAEMQA